MRARANPFVYEASSDYAEAQWIVDETKQFRRDGQDLREVAVLYRSNAQSRVIESALFNAGCRIRCMAACASSSAPR